MFGKKKKKETEEERSQRIALTAEKLRSQIAAIGNQKNVLLSKVMEARQKGLPAQEEQARTLLKRSMAAEKRANAMLMTLELAVQSRDLAELNKQFLEAIGSLSTDITAAASKTDTKRAEKEYMKAMYASSKQTAALDEMLAVGDYGAVLAEGADSYSEFDDEIDAMLRSAEASPTYRKTTI